MKKFALLIVAVMLFSITGCNVKKTGENIGTAQATKKPVVIPTKKPSAVTTKQGVNTTTAAYKDGTYTAYGDKWAFGQENATVKIKNGKMIYITLRRLDTAGKEVNYKIWNGKKDKTGKLHPNLNKFRVDLAKKMLARQTYVVDSISGATVSSTGWKLAVQRALDKAKQ